MKRFLLLAPFLAAALSPGCNDTGPYARATRITNRTQAIGGRAALADLGDYILENDRIRIALPERGNSTGPGLYGGSLMDADIQRPQAAFRNGRGKDQFTELFPIANLSIPAVCEDDREKIDSFCERLPKGVRPRITIVCDGQNPCELDPAREINADYALEGAMPSARAAILRVEGQAGNYLEALGLVKIANVKTNFRFRNDYILEPGEDFVRIRTLFHETRADGSLEDGELVALPSLTGAQALFGILLGSDFFDTHLEGLDPGVAGGDFLFFGARLGVFAPGIGFDIYKAIRNKVAVGEDPFNNPIAADFIAGVGEDVSYAIASADAGGKYLLPLYSGAVTAGFTHGAHCHPGPCPGTPEECANVLDCTGLGKYVFERLFAVGDGDVASAAAPIYRQWGTEMGRVRGHVYDRRTGQPVTRAEVHVYPVPATMGECRPGLRPEQGVAPYELGPDGFEEHCLEPRHYMGAVNHFRTDRRATDLPRGAFGGQLPAGRYYLLAKKKYHPTSRVVAIEVRADETTEVALHLLPPATIQFEVRDEQGRRLPSKLTVGQCFPECSGRFEEPCDADNECSPGKCVASSDGMRCLVDNCPSDRACDLESLRCVPRTTCSSDDDCRPVERCVAAPGSAEARCTCQTSFERQAALGEGSYPPGTGRYMYTPDGFGTLEMEPGSYEVLVSRGFEYGIDRHQVALVPGQTALVTARLAREVDTGGWITGDFHVHGQNSYDAVVMHADRVAAFAGEGVEMLSTSDHDYITDLAPWVFELGLDPWVATQVGLELTTVELGHFLGYPYRYREWKDGERVQEQGAIDWTGKTPDQLFDQMRVLGEYSPEETVITVAHPRDAFFGYFDQYGLNPYTMEAEGTLLEWLPGINVNPLADPELFSGRFNALELFNSKRFELIRTPTADEIRRYNLQRKVIQARTEQGASPDVIERALIALDRVFIKELLERTPAEQDAVWEATGEEGCALYTFCTSDEDCEQGQVCDRAGTFACYTPCNSDADCDGRPCIEGRCDPGLGPGRAPCTSHQGVVDDWFRMIEYGVVKTGMGNSDTHQMFTQTEAGIPRNFVRLSAETPRGIDRRELARNIQDGKVVASYGPFVETWLDGHAIGSTASATPGAPVELRIRVQSPHWFDVDRVEVYRSGRLIHVFTGEGDLVDPASRVDVSGLRLPNPRVVNLDAVIEETAPERDAWYVVVAMGLAGRDLSPIYGEHPYLKLQIGDILASSFQSVPVPFDIAGELIPRVFRIYPYAVTNPVFLDTDGNGRYDSSHERPAWAEGGRTLRSSRHPLSSARIGGTPLASPTDRTTFRARQLRAFMAKMRAGLHLGGGL